MKHKHRTTKKLFKSVLTDIIIASTISILAIINMEFNFVPVSAGTLIVLVIVWWALVLIGYVQLSNRGIRDMLAKIHNVDPNFGCYKCEELKK